MKIVLADAPLVEINNQDVMDCPNLGLLYLIAAVREAMPDLEIFYLDGYLSLEEHLREVERIMPDAYGISFPSPFVTLSYKTIAGVKALFPNVPVIAGGAHPTAAPADVLTRSQADYCCIAEGERTLVDWVRLLRDGGDPAAVKGLAWRDAQGQVRINEARPYIENLDDIPMPAWDVVDFGKYIGNRKTKATPAMAIIAARGCPFNCVFCANPVWKLQKPWLRSRSPQNIAQEVEHLYQRGVREVFIRSDEMNPNRKWCLEVFQTLRDLGHRDLYFQCNLKATPIDDELVRTLHEANCWAVHIGIESGNQRVLDGIHKMMRVQDIWNACRIMKRYKIKVFAFFMFYQAWETDGKLQAETPGEVTNSLWLLLRLRLRNMVHFMSWTLATPYPGSELDRLADKHKIRIPPPPGEVRDINNHIISMRLPGVTQRDIVRSRAMGLLLQGFFVVISPEFYRRGRLLSNLRHAARRLRYVLRPS